MAKIAFFVLAVGGKSQPHTCTRPSRRSSRSSRKSPKWQSKLRKVKPAAFRRRFTNLESQDTSPLIRPFHLPSSWTSLTRFAAKMAATKRCSAERKMIPKYSVQSKLSRETPVEGWKGELFVPHL